MQLFFSFYGILVYASDKLTDKLFKLFHLDFIRPNAGQTLASLLQTDVIGRIPVQK